MEKKAKNLPINRVIIDKKAYWSLSVWEIFLSNWTIEKNVKENVWFEWKVDAKVDKAFVERNQLNMGLFDVKVIGNCELQTMKMLKMKLLLPKPINIIKAL